MSTIDPAKLKVVELRAELSSRGLDSKGNKPVLVKRLKDALEKELEQEIPDTSIAETSTEELNTSQESGSEDVQSVPPDRQDEPTPEPQPEVEEKPNEETEEEKPREPSPEPVVTEPDSIEQLDASPERQTASPGKENDNEEPKETEEAKLIDEEMPEAPAGENGEKIDHEMQVEEKPVEEKPEEEAPVVEEQHKGEKRRRSSPSPERSQRRRSKTPIKEDEPPLDNNKVQLSWYDSDLHLQVDKKSFLSGKPYHDGAFGYAWAGVRATHGIRTGKICYEAKITEELKWDDFVKQNERKRDRSRDKYRNQKSDRDNSRSDQDKSRSDKDDSKTEKDESKTDKDELKTDKDKSKTDKDESKTDKDDLEMDTEDSKTYKDEVKTEKDESETDKDELKTDKDESKTDKDESKTDDEPKTDKESLENEKENAKTDEEAKSEENNSESPENSNETETASSKEQPQDGGDKAEAMEVEETPAEPIPKHLFRIGWSTLDSGLQLGEALNSYGYESSGKFVANKQFAEYAVKFSVGDVVGAYINIEDDDVTLTYTVNGEAQPVATSISKEELPEDFALFPHVLTRNYAFELNLGGREEPWYPHPESLEDYVYIENAEDKIQGPTRPETRAECEVIMMCGLPGSGKTHWVKEMIKDNPTKRYTVIGNSHLLAKMTVNGNPLKNSCKGRWNVILDKLTKCLNTLVETAALRRRNYVIDQTNVFPSAQRRKMRLFEGFKRRAVIVVVSDEEHAKRRAQQEAQDGKDVADSAILEMKANMSLPRRGDWLEEVTYVELPEDEAKTLIEKYNHQGREAGFGPIGGQRSGYRDNRGHPYRWDHSTSRRDYRGGYRDNRSYQNNRYDNRNRSHGWQNRRPPPGSWNRDIRRDGRGSRDFRNNRSSSGSSNRQDRSSSRDNRNRNQSSGSSSSGYNRNQRSQSNRNQAANWQSSGSWQSQGNWGGNQGMWNQSWGQGNWGNAQQWKGGYGQSGYGQSGYGNYANWNYYGQYPQNWNNQGQPQTTTAAGGSSTTATDSANSSYGQYSQQAWAQYAQQYAQQGQTAAQQPSTQK